jgi:hypothetical protein
MFKNLFGKSENNDQNILIKMAEVAKQEGASHVLREERIVMQAGPSVTFYRHNEGKVETATMEYIGGKKVYFWGVDPKKWAEKETGLPYWMSASENKIPSNAKPIEEVITTGIL